jgi:hypothetical protein
MDRARSAVRKRALPLLLNFAPVFLLWLWCVALPLSEAFDRFARLSPALFGVPGLLDLTLQCVCAIPFFLTLWWRSHFTWFQVRHSLSGGCVLCSVGRSVGE